MGENYEPVADMASNDSSLSPVAGAVTSVQPCEEEEHAAQPGTSCGTHHRFIYLDLSEELN